MKLKNGSVLCLMTCALAGAAGLAAAIDPPTAPPTRTAQPAGGPSAPASDDGATVTPVPGSTDRMTITGVVRDFRAHDASGGHPDFERYSTGHRVGMVQNTLDQDGKPVFVGQGQVVSTEYRDAQGRNINPAMYDAERRDLAGRLTPTSSPAVTNAPSFAQWYRDTAGVNSSKAFPITLVRQGDSSMYIFRAQDDPATPAIEGFFPADNDLFNDTNPTYHHNYHFTFEMAANFVYHRGTGQVFTFTGDDDVWVFIDGKLVIDLGGVHGAMTQTVDLDRLSALQDGQTYPLRFFFAERHTTASNCRIETSLTLVPAQLPATSALFD